MKDQITKLQSLLPKLGPSDVKFASDLIHSYHKYGSLTVKQEPWIAKLIERAENPQTKPEAPKVQVGDFSGVISLFKTAQAHLKYPKLNLVCLGKKVIISLAGPKSKNPGDVNLAGEGVYPNREWFGRVTPLGVWEPFHKVSPEMLTALGELLKKLAEKPARVAQEHGKLTGSCCFCNSPLTDPKSTAAGYGPVCSKNYGLFEQWKTAVLKYGVVEGTGFMQESMKKMVPLTVESVKEVIKEMVAEKVADEVAPWVEEEKKEEPKQRQLFEMWR